MELVSYRVTFVDLKYIVTVTDLSTWGGRVDAKFMATKALEDSGYTPPPDFSGPAYGTVKIRKLRVPQPESVCRF
jgi:hypothetical protein